MCRIALFSRVLLSIAVMSIAACATGYKTSGMTGGFKDTQLAPDVFRVSFRGNGYTSSEKVQDFALLRAAELCQQNGFSHFVVISSADQTRTDTIHTPSTATTNGEVSFSGRSAEYSSTTTFTPGQAMKFYMPGVGMMVRGLKEQPAGSFAFNSEFLVRTLKAKYGIE